jgi:hypothetical protein
MLGISVRNSTGGFRAYRATTLQKIVRVPKTLSVPDHLRVLENS